MWTCGNDLDKNMVEHYAKCNYDCYGSHINKYVVVKFLDGVLLQELSNDED